MRARINLYKDPAAAAAGGPGAAAAPAGAMAVPGLHDVGESEDDGEELPQVGLHGTGVLGGWGWVGGIKGGR